MVKRTTQVEQSSGPVCVSAEDYARLYRALRTLSAGNRTLARAPDELTLLQDMCNAIIEQGGYRMAWIGYAEHDERKTIRLMAHAGVVEGFFDVIDLSWADEVMIPTALAIRSGQPCVGHLVLEDPALQHLLNEELKRGYAAVSAFPLIIDGEVIGNLSIVASEADAFSEEEVNVLSELAEDVAFGISTLRNRKRQQEAEATIQHMALYDGLTGLPNRSLFQNRLEELIAGARQPFRPFAVSLLAVDHFREINDFLGPSQANDLLLQVAAKLGALLEENDLLARVSDDEFALLGLDTDADRAAQRAVRLLAPFSEPLSLSDVEVDARLRIGIALFPGHGSDADALMRRATVAAREARHTSANYAIFSGNLDRACTEHFTMIAELQRAIARDELRLYCQPKVQIATGELCGAEALVRWEHPEHGLLGPDQFIKLAEKAGLITPLTNWVLGAAFSQAYAWQADGLALPLAVNLSARDLLDPRLIDRIRGLFLTWGVEPSNMQFELTESALMEDPSGALDTLNRLKALGVQLAVDDFGTGFSSLSYLQRLPADSIKIDQSFVGRMIDNEGSDTIVRSTIDLGHNLGLHVVAEGVENRAIWERLTTLGCDIAQGYFISQPIPVEQFATWQSPGGLSHPAVH
jgi:diguanylate cyclase (GGDEF)-like protein